MTGKLTMCYSIQQCGRHFLVAKDRWPFTEGQVGGDDDRGALIKMREQAETSGRNSERTSICMIKRLREFARLD